MLTKKDLENYFSIQQKKATECLDVCLDVGETVLKGIRMRNNLSWWPYRTIAAIDNKINKRLKNAIVGPSLTKAVNAVTRAYDVHKEKEERYDKLLSDMREELVGKEDVIRELEAAAAGGGKEEDNEKRRMTIMRRRRKSWRKTWPLIDKWIGNDAAAG